MTTGTGVPVVNGAETVLEVVLTATEVDEASELVLEVVTGGAGSVLDELVISADEDEDEDEIVELDREVVEALTITGAVGPAGVVALSGGRGKCPLLGPVLLKGGTKGVLPFVDGAPPTHTPFHAAIEPSWTDVPLTAVRYAQLEPSKLRATQAASPSQALSQSSRVLALLL